MFPAIKTAKPEPICAATRKGSLLEAPAHPGLLSLAPPTLRERRHRGLARLGVAVRRRAIFVISEGQRPHPRRSYRPGMGVEDAADDSPIGEHIVIGIRPFA